MQQKPVIKNISIFPVKSLDGITLQNVQIGKGGSLKHDREFAIVDVNGKFVNGKSNALVHLLRSHVDFDNEFISFRQAHDADWSKFQLQDDRPAINEYLSTFFSKFVSLIRNAEGEFLDVPVKSGITVLSTASLETVAGWFNNMPIQETRERFRANIELENVPAFWEDYLFYDEDSAIEFKIGDVVLYGMSPRARCIVPTRHPQTGEPIHMFQKSFAMQRAGHLPNWSSLENYTHSYYLSVDCYVPPSEFGKWLKVGDELTIIGSRAVADIASF